MEEARILEQKILKVDIKDAAALSVHDKEAFSKIRKNGLGASDSSIYLGYNQWNTVDTLLTDKLSVERTENDEKIGNLVNVRKGIDLEPLILHKFEEYTGNTVQLIKPKDQYRFILNPQLTINFDGVYENSDGLIPVEAKYVSAYAGKYWDVDKCVTQDMFLNNTAKNNTISKTLSKRVPQAAESNGIPVYYYTQVQQEIMALDAPYGYLAALFDKDWKLRVFKIYKEGVVQEMIIQGSSKFWRKLENTRRSTPPA